MIGALTSVVIEPLAGALEDVRVRLDGLCGAAGALQASAFPIYILGSICVSRRDVLAIAYVYNQKPQEKQRSEEFDDLAASGIAAGCAAGPSVLSTTQGTVVDKDYSRRVQRAPRNKRPPR